MNNNQLYVLLPNKASKKKQIPPKDGIQSKNLFKHDYS